MGHIGVAGAEKGLWGSLLQDAIGVIRLMEEILHHLRSLKSQELL